MFWTCSDLEERSKSAEEFSRQAKEHRLPVCVGPGKLLHPISPENRRQSIIGVPPVPN